MDIDVPTLVLDAVKCRRNIENMAGRARRLGLRLRPHFKTHQSQEIGRWFRDFGVSAITVSSLRMAAYFADDGWSDILVAFPFNLRELPIARALARRVDLHLTVENPEAVQLLARELQGEAGLYIKADTGYHRTGLGPEQFAEIDDLLDRIAAAPNLRFRGFLAHAGHTYDARGADEIKSVHEASRQVFRSFRARYADRFPGLQLSLGDTPACSVADDFGGVDEMRPGNFVFYDLMQAQIGACALGDIAVAMVCPVVAKHPRRGEAVIYGGSVHFSKDGLTVDGRPCYGRVVQWTGRGWEIPETPVYLKKLSQEHGILQGPGRWVEHLQIGQLLAVLPVHSCLTADINKKYVTLAGERIGMLPNI